MRCNVLILLGIYLDYDSGYLASFPDYFTFAIMLFEFFHEFSDAPTDAEVYLLCCYERGSFCTRYKDMSKLE
jgi:hypothetical protein